MCVCVCVCVCGQLGGGEEEDEYMTILRLVSLSFPLFFSFFLFFFFSFFIPFLELYSD